MFSRYCLLPAARPIALLIENCSLYKSSNSLICLVGFGKQVKSGVGFSHLPSNILTLQGLSSTVPFIKASSVNISCDEELRDKPRPLVRDYVFDGVGLLELDYQPQ